MRSSLLLALLLLCIFSNAQKCETFDRSLMPFLPEYIPDIINCVDQEGNKQGYWIHYKIKYDKGIDSNTHLIKCYVPEYSFGLYKNNKKIATWEYVHNDFFVYTYNIEYYEYYGDSVVITKRYERAKKIHKHAKKIQETPEFVKYEYQGYHNNFPITIQCNKKSKKAQSCIMRYRGRIISRFQPNDLEYLIDNYHHLYEKEKFLVDRKKKVVGKTLNRPPER